VNEQDRRSAGEREALVKFGENKFELTSMGTFVRCAITGTAIPLTELRYWSVDWQEAYANPEAVLERLCASRV
jgi:hypothetical protein